MQVVGKWDLWRVDNVGYSIVLILKHYEEFVGLQSWNQISIYKKDFKQEDVELKIQENINSKN